MEVTDQQPWTTERRRTATPSASGSRPTALPPALFSAWHNVTGPALASYFLRNEPAAAGKSASGAGRSGSSADD